MAAEERLRSAKLAVAGAAHEANAAAQLVEHGIKVATQLAEMREGGSSELAVAVYEAEQALEEAKIGGAKVSI